MNLDTLLQMLDLAPERVEFADTVSAIDAIYDFTPTRFKNGAVMNAAGQNSGSCKIFAFAQLQGLSPQKTLACFGAYYRDDVLKHPEGTDHQNIRNFITHGWTGIQFDRMPLALKQTR